MTRHGDGDQDTGTEIMSVCCGNSGWEIVLSHTADDSKNYAEAFKQIG